MLGGSGLIHSTKLALLNANYMMKRLENHYRVKFVNDKGRCAHEFIIDLAEWDEKAGLKVMDFAKRLQVSCRRFNDSLGEADLLSTCRTTASTLPPAHGLFRLPCW